MIKKWWVKTWLYKVLHLFQHELVLIENKTSSIETKSKNWIEEKEGEVTKLSLEAESLFDAWEDKLSKHRQQVINKLTNKTMTEEESNAANLAPGLDQSNMKLGAQEPTELEKVVDSLKSHADNLSVKLGSISEVAKKLNPSGFAGVVITGIDNVVEEGTGIVDVIKGYVSKAEALVENIEVVAGFIKKQV